MEADVTILVDSYNADFLKSLTHSALLSNEIFHVGLQLWILSWT